MNKLKIALMEDDEVLSAVLRDGLERAGFEVAQAFDGEEGLGLVRSWRPDLILLDIVMPKMDGFEFLDALKASPDSNQTSRPPVIIISMSGKDEGIKRALEVGVDDYILKSQHTVAEVIEKVKEFFSKERRP